MEISILGFPIKDLLEDPHSNTDRQKEVAITKKFIKDSTLSRRESWQALGVATALKIEGSFPFM